VIGAEQVIPPTAEERPHLDALRRARSLGFFPVGGSGMFLERRAGGVVETITFVDMSKAMSARWLASDYERGVGLLWQKDGTIADVIGELLELPPHRFPGAPTLVIARSSGLMLAQDFS
jgi:hypothetical protein